MIDREQTISVGDRVRSFDFPYFRDTEGEHAHYVEGVVVGYQHLEGCLRYVIAVDRHVISGEDRDLSDIPANERQVFPPMNGTPTLGGRVTNGVARV